MAITWQKTAKWLAAVGKAGLVVKTDDLVNAAAVVVVLDSEGSFLAKQATIIGDDD
jgi:hypothetical protein